MVKRSSDVDGVRGLGVGSSPSSKAAAVSASASSMGRGVGSETYILLVINTVRCFCSWGRTYDELAKNDQNSSASAGSRCLLALALGSTPVPSRIAWVSDRWNAVSDPMSRCFIDSGVLPLTMVWAEAAIEL